MSGLLSDFNPASWQPFSLDDCGAFTSAFLLAFLTFLIVRTSKFFEASEVPTIIHSSSPFAVEVLEKCSILQQRYRPTRFWGKNAHAQAWLFGFFGRWRAPAPQSSRHTAMAEDGASFTLQLFENEDTSVYDGCRPEDQPVVAVCPGINGHCRSAYMMTFVDNILRTVPHSRVVVLNHLGTDTDRELNVPRIFSYGCTMEYSALIDWVRDRYPSHPLIGAGFSMGGNILTKYLGEKPERQSWFAGALSCGQGYQVDKCASYFHTGLAGRVYGLVILLIMVCAVRPHRVKLFSHHENKCCACKCPKKSVDGSGCCACVIPPPDEARTFQAWNLRTFDEYYSRRVWKYKSLDDFYFAESCGPVMHQITDVPILFLNAEDDPLVPPQGLGMPSQHASRNANSLAVCTRHGSHLAYFEGGLLIPQQLSWMDRLATQYFNAVLAMR